MRSLRLILPAYALLAAGVVAAQQPQPLTMLPPDAHTAPALPRIAPSPQRPLSAAEAQALVGHSVQTREGQPAGEIHDFTLAGPDGRIDRIVLSQGGFLGFGARLTAVPATALRIGAAPTLPQPGQYRPMEISVDLSQRDLDEAPPFDYGQDTLSLSRRR